MEEILASIKRIIEDTDSVKRPVQPVAADEPGDIDVDLHTAANDAALGADISSFRDELHAAAAPESVKEAEAEAPAVAAFASLSRRFDEVVSAPQPVPVEAESPRPAIISDQTGRQVAAAFGELNDAFAASRKRSFDEMAEEMMRPMLQEWMDNNLPLLVERLVREEIERVARGGAK